MLVLAVLCVIGLIPYVTPESCYYLRCIGCNTRKAITTGKPVECRPSNWVTSQWIRNSGYPPSWMSPNVPIEYRCLKMLASPDDKLYDNTVDILRGCVPEENEEYICLVLKTMEIARGRTNVICLTCNTTNCNSARRPQILATHILIISSVFYYLFL